MSILRNDTQVALNDLHRALQESADHYQYAADFLEGSAASDVCAKLVRERRGLAARVADAIRESGELPGEADRDLEAAEQIRQRFEALVEGDEVSAVVTHRLDAEGEFLAFLERDVRPLLGDTHSELLSESRKSVDHARELLGSLGAA